MVTGKHETVYSFGHYLRQMIADTRARGATPILMTLTRTNTWQEGRITCASDTYRLWDWQTAQNENVAFVDLSRIIADRYQREGADAVTAQFINDTVHTNVAGANQNAARCRGGTQGAARAAVSQDVVAGAAAPCPRIAGRPKTSVCPAL